MQSLVLAAITFAAAFIAILLGGGNSSLAALIGVAVAVISLLITDAFYSRQCGQETRPVIWIDGYSYSTESPRIWLVLIAGMCPLVLFFIAYVIWAL